MRRITKYIKTVKTTYFFTTGVIFMVALFFAPVFSGFEEAGDNFFTVRLNGQTVGSCSDKEELDGILMEARRKVAEESEEMVYIPADLQLEGQQLLFGQVDSKETLLANIEQVLQDSVLKTLKHAYTVKINEYMVNLGSSQEVLALLQAALDRYDTQGEYQVNLIPDPDRELNVLTTQVVRKEESKEEARAVGEGVGVAGFLDELFAEVEPDVTKREFSSLEYGLVDLDFGDTVEVVDAYLMDSEITPLETAVTEVTAEQEKEQIYEVQSGDTLSQIAEESGIPMEELIAINPMLENENSMIRVGDELKITVPEPALSVVHSQQVYIEDSYDAEIQYVDNDNWYTTESKVLQQPSAGFRKAAAVVTYRNDTEVSQSIIKEEVVSAAVPKIVERGTKIPPTFIKPISGGRISSSFGRRNAPTKGASTNHKGVDWAIPTGTAVMASSGGTVTRAGWGSGYGYVVYIQHEGGRETRYGHLSKVLVKAGEKVKQGQKIALSGNTGRSTGPHLHFELRINGGAVDPYKYFN